VKPTGVTTPKFKQRAINFKVEAVGNGNNNDFNGAGKPINDSNIGNNAL
jgi:hypothetical protein